MDPITTAIIAAIASGVTKEIAASTYVALKDLIVRKYGKGSKLVRAVKDVEVEPDSAGYQTVLKEQVAKAKADQDPELVKAAQALLEKVKAQPGGAQVIQQAIGNYNAQASGGSTATVTVTVPKP